jgi:hypothetical protein
LWFSDGAQPRINTMEIQGRTYYNRLKYIYNPIYKSFYCDNEATVVANMKGKMIRSGGCIIKHFHPAIVKTIQEDDLYRRNNLYWNEDKETFRKREAIKFA